MAVRSRKVGTIYTEFQRSEEYLSQADITEFSALTVGIDTFEIYVTEMF